MSLLFYLQDVTNDSQRPHVRLRADRLVVDDLGRDELWRSEKHPDGRCGVQFLGEPKVYDLDLVRGPRVAHDVLGLEVEMDDVLTVHVGDALTYLAHKQDAVFFGESEVVGDDSLEEFASRDAEGKGKI